MRRDWREVNVKRLLRSDGCRHFRLGLGSQAVALVDVFLDVDLSIGADVGRIVETVCVAQAGPAKGSDDEVEKTLGEHT